MVFINLAAAIDVPLSEIAKQNVAKLKKRYLMVLR